MRHKRHTAALGESSEGQDEMAPAVIALSPQAQRLRDYIVQVTDQCADLSMALNDAWDTYSMDPKQVSRIAQTCFTLRNAIMDHAAAVAELTAAERVAFAYTDPLLENIKALNDMLFEIRFRKECIRLGKAYD